MPRSRKRRSRREPSTSSSTSTASSSSSSSANNRSRKKRHRKDSKTVSQSVLLSSVIPEFDPLVDSVDMWINVVEANSRAFGWSDNMIKYQALQKLRNTAKTWLDALQKNETRWTTWKWKQWRETLSDTFQVKRNMFRSLKELIDSKPSANQSLYEFFFKQKAKIDRLQLGFRESDIVSIIVGSIGDKNMSVAAEAGNFKYCDDLASFLHGKVNSPAETEVLSKNSWLPKHSSRPLQSGNHNTTNKFDSKNEPSVVNNNINSVSNTCYRCGEVGHRRNNCAVKDNVRCSYCNKLGHLEAACKSKSKLKVEKNVEVKMISDPKTRQKFYKPVLLNNVECNAFFDMGSDCSLITTELVNKFKLQPISLNKPINLVGFTNDLSAQVTEAVAVTLKVDSVELIITLYIIDALSGCDILIGRNFTEDKNIMYVRVGETLTFQSVQAFNVCNIKITNSVSAEYKMALNNILLKYPQCFSQDLSSLGKTSCVELEIQLTSNKPICQRPYRMSESERAITRDIIDDLLNNGIVQNSNSAYASPALLVDKASGAKRLCVDYRQLNKITVKEKYPMPMIEDLIDRLQGCKFYTSLDLKSGYHQICIKAEDVHKTAFITSDGHFEYLRMPFGVCNGPAVFQRLMNTVLGNLRFGRVICYMDDLLIATKTIEENMVCLEMVLDILVKNRLTVNLDKCSFFRDRITFLGYDISEQGVRPSSRKLEAISKYPIPKTVHQLRQFLGLINYFRKFIKDCAILCKPLTSLLKKGAIWQWGLQQDQAVASVKEALIKNAVLSVFNPKLPINLYTDASRDGIGCILTQLTDSGEKPVYFYSRQTSNDEKKYHSFELELLAIISGLQKFRHYLLGTDFKIITDCNAVRHALSKKEIIPRISRWVLYTQDFTFDVVHRAGSQMQHVDALSRNPIGTSGNAYDEVVSVNTITEGDWLLAVQLQDPNICSIRDILQSGEAETNKHIFNEYELVGNKVYRRTEFGRRWLVPKQCIWYVVRANHDDLGHFAVDKTVERIRSKYWFPRLKKTVSKYIKNCLNCIYYKNIHGKKPGKLYPIPKFARPFHTLHIDHLGPFVKTTQQNSYLLVIVDSFTKFVFISAVKNTKSKVVINELNKIFKVFGNPKRLVCDAGSAFTSKLFTNYCKERNIRAHIIATAVPRSNGQVERYNQTILEALRSMSADTDSNKWDQHVTNIQQGINSTINKTTCAVPSEVFFGFRIRMNNDAITDDNNEHSPDVTALRNMVDANIKSNAERQKASFDSKRKEAPNYKVGDLVVLKIPSHTNDGQSTKLMPLYKGPFQVTNILGHDRYQVADMRGAERSSKRYDGVACVENMKPWIRIVEEPDVVKNT